ncbi:serine/threonine-protein kinase PLK [Elysia marginata]|uniref:Serine/threonine-protein kinase PLK n=1 Tax=Elysia marginata TaxID=1093978 RepID=A0AAV4HTB1_9GAST|nr:serine/threonine-protein kinase PLK [Elysia marginata]
MENLSSPGFFGLEPEVLQLEGDFFSTFQFEEGRVLGHGLSGVVVEATSITNPQAKVAVKKFALLGSDGGIKKTDTFLKEVSIMQSVSHPHIAPCVLAARCPLYLALAMPLYSLGSLESQLSGLCPALARHYLSQIASAVRHLHLARIAHGDLKLDNVFLMDAQHAVLGDFGLAVRLSENSMGLVPASQCGGTPSYMAPEAKDAGDGYLVDPVKLDIYALGVMLWCMLVKVKASWTYDYLEETNTDPDVPDNFRPVLRRVLEPLPLRRASLDELVQALDRLQV